MKLLRLFMLAVAFAVVGSLLWQRRPTPVAPEPLAALRGSGVPLTVALTGDTVLGAALDADAMSALTPVAALLGQASLAVTDLDQPLRDADDPPPATAQPRWPIGDAEVARQLRTLGFTVVTLANAHVSNEEGEGAPQTAALLARAGMWTTGAGTDLDAARRAVVVGNAPHRVAVLAVATSVPPASRASRRRGEIDGRPGVNTLRYSPRVTADETTFAALSQLARAMDPTNISAAADRITLSGATISRGERTSVTLEADADDLAALVDGVRAARTAADVVIVSLHAQEPGHRSDVPDPLLRDLAHRAIDAGASLVVGHGARQLRGIEVYNGGAVAYGLGSFAFMRAAIPAGAATVFDADVSAYDLAIGAVPAAAARQMPSLDEAIWWDAVVATARFDGSTLVSIHLAPIDLGADRPIAGRGLPQLATGPKARTIVERMTRLSSAFGTAVSPDGEGGVIQVNRPAAARNNVAAGR